MAEKIFISLGSNLGDRDKYLDRALEQLTHSDGINVVALSSRSETEPIGLLEQPKFLNQVALLETTLDPEALLNRMLTIERSLGRERKERWGPRTIDLDILFFGSRKIDTETLKVPHPEIINRKFFLDMIEEISSHDLEQCLLLDGKKKCNKDLE